MNLLSANPSKCLATAIMLATAGTSVHAASLTQIGWDFLHSQNNGLTGGENLEHNISVYGGSAGYAGSDGGGAATSGTFGDGTVVSYNFWRRGGPSGAYFAESYASSGGLITGSTTDVGFNTGNATDLWETTNPSGFTTTPDFASGTNLLGLTNFSGTINISGLASGNIYFIYGHYRGGNASTTGISLTMKDTQAIQSDVLLTAGTTDTPNNWEHYVVNVSFVNDAGHDTIDYSFNFNATGQANGRISGIVMDGVAIPEPGIISLFGLGAFALLLRRRR